MGLDIDRGVVNYLEINGIKNITQQVFVLKLYESEGGIVPTGYVRFSNVDSNFHNRQKSNFTKFSQWFKLNLKRIQTEYQKFVVEKKEEAKVELEFLNPQWVKFVMENPNLGPQRLNKSCPYGLSVKNAKKIKQILKLLGKI